MTNERQQHEGTGRQLRVDDMSEETQGVAIPPVPRSTRSRVAADNPLVNNPMSEERYKASIEAARRGAIEAKRAAEEAYQNDPPQVPVDESIPPEKPAVPKPQLKADLRQLAFTGRVEAEVVVGGYSFLMRTLTSKENNEAAAALGLTGNDLQKMGELRHAILARAVVSVNGVALEGLYTGNEKLTPLQKKEIVIGSWQQTLVTELMLEYNKLLERSQNTFTSSTEEDLKN